MIGIIIASVVILILMFILFIPINIKIKFYYDDNDTEYSLRFRIMFFEFKKPEKKHKKEAQESDEKDIQKKSGTNIKEKILFVIENRRSIKEALSVILEYVFKHLIIIKYLKIHSVIGTDDAMDTALIYGWVSCFVYNIIGVTDRYTKLKEQDTDIKPDFDNTHISVDFYTIIKINMFHCVVALIKIIKHGYPIVKRFNTVQL